MKPAPFDYHAPRTIDEAVALLAQLDDAKVIAGGQSLAPLLNMRLAHVGAVIDIRHLAELTTVEVRSDAVRIGAAVTQNAVARDPGVGAAVPLLAEAIPLIGHAAIRNRGTIGGSIAHADPASELPSVARTLDAAMCASSPRGARTIAATDFFVGTWSTTLAEDELLTAVEFPVWAARSGFAVEEFARRRGDFAIAGACVGVTLDVDDIVKRCAIGLFGLGSMPLRATAAESSVVGSGAADVDHKAVGAAAVADLVDVPDDLNGSSAYRRRVGATVVARALHRALDEARRG